jgi:phage terminase large subunit
VWVVTLEVQIDYVPRPWQNKFENNIGERKRAFLLWARRHGKDIACWNYLILKAIERRGSYYYLYPMQNQARKAIWEGMTSTGKRFLEYIPRELFAKDPNNSEMAITLINGSIIRILGSDNHDALRSSNPIGVVFSEYAFHHPNTWTGIVEPILQENKGWALFNTTPFGRNHAYDLWQYAVKNPETWYTEKVTNDDSQIISAQEFEEMVKRGVSQETIEQEYFCNFDRGVEGSYYARKLTELRQRGHIREVRKDDYAQVHTVWDIGFGDSTSIFWYQVINNEIWILDHYENHGEGIAHYINVLEERKSKYKYIYGMHFMPHDAKAGSFELGMTRVQYANELGLSVVVLPREGIDNGIERCRKILSRCYFDEKKCDFALKCLENYRKVYDEKHRVYADKPLHDFTSHCADSFRYLCQSVEIHHSGSSQSLEDYRAMKKKYGVGGQQQNDSILGN